MQRYQIADETDVWYQRQVPVSLAAEAIIERAPAKLNVLAAFLKQNKIETVKDVGSVRSELPRAGEVEVLPLFSRRGTATKVRASYPREHDTREVAEQLHSSTTFERPE